MLNRNEILRIERTLAKLQEGDLYDPVETRGFGTYHSIAVRLEALRVAMLKLKDSETDSSLRANKSIASVAHDMKTPLAIISGYAECISDGMDDKDYPALIIQKTDQMNEMVIGMVESSNAEIRKQSAHKTLHPARNFFGKTIEKLRPLAQARDIKLKVGKIPDVEVRVDEGQMERVVQNLLSNAVKYSNKGQTVKVGAKKKGKRFILYVRDNGIGISKESLPYVFDQFYTEDKNALVGQQSGRGTLRRARDYERPRRRGLRKKQKRQGQHFFNRASARSRRRRRHYRHCKIRQPFAYVEMRHRVLFRLGNDVYIPLCKIFANEATSYARHGIVVLCAVHVRVAYRFYQRFGVRKTHFPCRLICCK